MTCKQWMAGHESRCVHNRIQLQLCHGSHLPAELVAWERQNVESTGSAAIPLKQRAQSRVVRVLRTNAMRIALCRCMAVQCRTVCAFHYVATRQCSAGQKLHKKCVDYLQRSGARNVHDEQCLPPILAERYRLAILQRRKIVDALGCKGSACVGFARSAFQYPSIPAFQLYTTAGNNDNAFRSGTFPALESYLG
jgi:hypothetical protein